MIDGQLIARGVFTSDGSNKDIPLRSDFDIFRTVNYTQCATTQSTGRSIRHEWHRGMADGYSLMQSKQNSSNAVDQEVATSGGFLRIDQSVQTLGPAVAISGITAASPAVMTTSSAHGLVVGDRVRVYGTTGMLQIAGYDFTVTAVGSSTTATFGYLDASGFAAAATAGYMRKVPNNPIFFPNNLLVTAVTAADPMVATFSVTHELTVGEKVRFHVPVAYGMSEADQLLAEVTAVNTSTNTATFGNVSSAAFTAFAFPTSATASAGVTPAHARVFADNPSLTNAGAVQNQAQILMRLYAGADGPAGSSSDVIYWEALKSGFQIVE